jgi:hypothetical protein
MSNFVERQNEPASRDGKTYRLSKDNLVIGLLLTPYFAAMGVWSSIGAWTNLDGSFPHPKAMAVVLACFWTAWTLLGIYIVFIYFRIRLSINGQFFESVGCFRTRAIDVSSVSRAVWRWFPIPSVVLYGRGRRLAVSFDNFNSPAKRELINYFRVALPEHVQDGWERFKRRVVQEPPGLQNHTTHGQVGDLSGWCLKLTICLWTMYLLSWLHVPIQSESLQWVWRAFLMSALLVGTLNALIAVWAILRGHRAYFWAAMASLPLAGLCWWQMFFGTIPGRF